MPMQYRTIEIHSELKREFVDFAIEAHRRFPNVPDVRKAVLTQSGNVVKVTLPLEGRVDTRSEKPRDDVSMEEFFGLAEDMFMLGEGESPHDQIAWVA